MQNLYIGNETNPYLRRQKIIHEAKDKWQESEMLLDYLRTQGDSKPKTLNDEETLQWAQNLP